MEYRIKYLTLGNRWVTDFLVRSYETGITVMHSCNSRISQNPQRIFFTEQCKLSSAPNPIDHGNPSSSPLSLDPYSIINVSALSNLPQTLGTKALHGSQCRQTINGHALEAMLWSWCARHYLHDTWVDLCVGVWGHSRVRVFVQMARGFVVSG